MRTDYCGLIDTKYLDQTVTLFGWVHRRRDHGGVIFIDLRDREGIVQVVCDPDTKEAFETADRLRSEYVIEITGRVRRRPDGTVNSGLISGEIEVLAKAITQLNAALTPPFTIDDEDVSENVRLEHRVFDLRRPQMQHSLRLRYRVAMAVRRFLDENGFIDIETPFLYKSTPEGAREFLVPSRVHDGHFYALPQSPQLFKQMIMIAGFDRYYQIVKCFRDEDLRADRQPEFTQIDIEVSFLDEQQIRDIMEQMIRVIFKTCLNVELPEPFPVMRYDDVVRLYGSDKPDLRPFARWALAALRATGLGTFTQPALVVFVVVPRDVAGMRITDQRVPLLAREQLNRAPAIGAAAHPQASKDKRPRVPRVVQHMERARMREAAPDELALVRSRAQASRKRELLLAHGLHRRPRRAGAAERVEKMAQRRLDLGVRIKHHLPRSVIGQAHRQGDLQLSSPRFVQDAAAQPRPQHVQLGLAHRSLEPEQQPIIKFTRIVDAVFVEDQRAGQRTNLEQPVEGVAQAQLELERVRQLESVRALQTTGHRRRITLLHMPV